MGEATLTVLSHNDNDGTSLPIGGYGQQQSGSRSRGSGLTISEHGRALLRPDEVLRMPGYTAILFHKNLPPILSERIRYYSDRAFRRRWLVGYGKGRPPGLGLGGMLLALAALLVAGMATLAVMHLPVPAWQPAAIMDRPGPVDGQPGYHPLPYSPPPYWQEPAEGGFRGVNN